MTKIELQFKEQMALFDELIPSLPWANKGFYQEYLAQTYYYVRHSSRFLSLCSANCKLEDSKLQQRFIQHLAEENNHEILCLKDLKRTGASIEEFTERNKTKNLYTGQYYQIEHLGPKRHFGYILALEGIAVTQMKLVNALVQKEYGLSATSFIRVHAEEDPSHLEKAFKEIQSFDEATQEKIIEDFKYSCFLYFDFLLGVKESLNLKNSSPSTAVA